eukprot:TRINITY_DN7916_c0_g1_i1.p1 TRINITY_DN7916_c0_g1~~TRINITY_DN7916_c0_g1_i1.p1  ORF type:complete len:388 (+),score=35.90 TRINITY_DN7916_c0_g1_i1:47-1210(+)
MFIGNFNTGDAGRAGFLEMIAEHQFMPSFEPAFKYLFTVLSMRYPRLETVVKYHDEIFAGARLLIERHYLQSYDASFSENFYGLKRVQTTAQVGKNRPIVQRDRILSLIFLVVVPYLKSKADQLYLRNSANSGLRSLGLLSPFSGAPIVATATGTETTTDNDTNNTDTEPEAPPTSLQRLRALLKRCFILGYPAFNSVYEGAFFLYQLMYLYDYTRYYTPFLHLQRLEVKRMTMEDMIMQRQNSAAQRALLSARIAGFGGGPINAVARGMLSVWHFLMDYSPYILPLALFLYNFFEWWHTEHKNATPSVPIPPPPTAPKKLEGGLELPKSKLHCPICRRRRTNPAILPSGFAFCYPCIHHYLELHSRCPITRLPFELDHIRKIYEPK